jgi:hypothetical protein
MKGPILHYAWIGAILFGFVLVGAGLFMVYQGMAAHDEIRDTLASEKIVTAADSDLPNVAVTGPAEAKAQSDAIWAHVMKQTGGKTYAELPQGDPLRATYLQSVTLRTALMESYLAFKVSDLVMGIGLIVALLGVSQVVLGGFLGLMVQRNGEPRVGKTPAATPAAL